MRIQKVGYAVCAAIMLISAFNAQISGVQESFAELQQELKEVEQSILTS